MTRRDGETGRIGLIAGSGRLPIAVAAQLRSLGHDPFILLIEGEAGEEPEFVGGDHTRLAVEDFGILAATLRKAGVKRVVMAGGVSKRPRLSRMRPSLALLRILPRVALALASGDDALLRAVIGHLEANGLKVVGAHEIVPDLVAAPGAMTRAAPDSASRRDIAAALQAARAIGGLDIGQAAIAVGGRVVALEGVEGTAGLLERMVALRSHGRLAGKSGGVLVKCAKPGQELRADLPAIGPETVDAALRAGLKGIAVEAGRALVLDYGETVRRADAAGLFIAGIVDEEKR